MPWPSESDTAELYYSPASPRSLFNVGLCLSCLSFRFLLAGSVRVGGGVPIARRAAAFTADAARNGLGLRILDGTIRLSRSVRNGYRDRSAPVIIDLQSMVSQSIEESRSCER